MADGTIIIDSRINVNGVKVGVEDIRASVQRMAGATSEMGVKAQGSIQQQANAMYKLTTAYSVQEAKVRALAAEMERYRNTKLPTEEYAKIQTQISETERKLNALIQRQDRFLATGGSKRSTTYRRMQYDIEELTNTIKYAKGELQAMEESGQAFAAGKDTEKFARLVERYRTESQKLENMNNTVASSFQRMRQQFLQYRTGLLDVDRSQKKVSKSAREMGKSHNKAKKGVASLVSYFKTILKYGLGIRSVYILVNKFRNAVVDGFKNLAQYSDDTNAALSLLMSRLTQLKNTFSTAFTPIAEYVAPSLAKFISLLAESVTWTSQLLAALTGKDTFVKAVQVQQDYADSLDKSKDKTDDLKDSTEKAVAPFDKLIQLQSPKKKSSISGVNDNELKPSDMFETIRISNEMKGLADNIKKVFSDLFTPLKQSWEANSPAVLSAVQSAFGAFKQLASDVVASFLQIWNTEGYGKTITDDLLITFSNLVQTVENLVNKFDEAWISGETGTNIMRHLGDILLEITGFFREASESLKNWSNTLDFSPLLESFDGVLVAIKPIVKDVGNLILWFLNNALLPITKWALEQALPTVFELIAAALKVVHSIIEALQPLAIWLWEEFLQPIGKWTGEVIIAALQKLTEWLTKFSDWISQHQTAIENITIAVVAFFAAWKVIQFIDGISQIIASMGGLLGIGYQVISMIASTIAKINPLHLAIAAIISLVAILAKNWKNMSPSEKVISGILAAAAAVAILAVALGAVKGAIGAALVAGALAAGIVAATITINAGKRATSSQSYNSGNSRAAYPMSAYAAIPYNPPMLATGTVVPPRAGISYFGIGDNNHEPEVVSPLSTIKQAIKEVITESGMDIGGKNLQIDMYVKDQVFASAVYKANNQEQQRIGIRMVKQNG